jgi:hypothetical protein
MALIPNPRSGYGVKPNPLEKLRALFGGGGAAPTIAANPAIPAASGGGGGKIDPEKWQKIAPIIGMAASALLAPKGYRGLTMGSQAQTANVLDQQRAERERQERIDAWAQEDRDAAKAARAKAEEQQKKLMEWILKGNEALATTMAPGETFYGGDTTEAAPAQKYPWESAGYGAHVPPEDKAAYEAAKKAGTMPVASAVAGAQGGTGAINPPGDPMARFWADAVKASGGAEWAVQGALQHYASAMQPKTQGPTRDVRLIAQVLDPENPYIAMLVQPGLTAEEFDKAAYKALEWKKEQGATPEEIEEVRLKLELLRAQIAKTKADAVKTGAGGSTTPKTAKSLEDAYNSYVKSLGESDLLGGGTKPKSMRQWIADTYGQAVLDAYDKEKTGGAAPAGVGPKSTPGDLVKKYKGVSTAILAVIYDPNIPDATKQALVTRYNQNHGTSYTIDDWAQAKDKGLSGPKTLKK